MFAAGDEVEVDIEKDILTQLSTGKTYPLKPLGEVSDCKPSFACQSAHACRWIVRTEQLPGGMLVSKPSHSAAWACNIGLQWLAHVGSLRTGQ